MPLNKKAKMRRQGVSLKKQGKRRDLHRAAKPIKNAGADGTSSKTGNLSGSDASNSGSSTGKDSSNIRSSAAKRVRSQGTGKVSPSKTQARRARADAKADVQGPPALANPVRNRSKATVEDTTNAGKTAERRTDTKIDFATGRVLFPVEVGGKTLYLPLKSEATEHERRNGNFVSTESIQKEAVNTLEDGGDSVQDLINQRELFATINVDGKREYLPSESDADPLELANGKYIPDGQLEGPSVALGLLDTDANKKKQQLRYDFTHQRNLFAVRSKDGRDIYVPQKSKATAMELKRGLYIDDAEISQKIDLDPATALTNDPARLDLVNKRKVYAVKDENDKTRYFPKESEANAMELARGLFIPDDVVIQHEHNQRQTALHHREKQADQALRRAQRADHIAGGAASNKEKKPESAPKPVTVATNGTEIWDGFSLPEVPAKKQQETLKKLRPVYDLNESRMLYPTLTAKGKTKYLPLLKDATDVERITQNYAAFVPQAPLAKFIADAEKTGNIQRQTFDTVQGQVQAYSQDAINQAFVDAPILVLRSAQLVSQAAKLTPELQQKWTE